MKKTIKVLNRIVDRVLSYKPKKEKKDANRQKPQDKK